MLMPKIRRTFLTAFCLLVSLLLSVREAGAQKPGDEPVATISFGDGRPVSVITYSDLITQLALEASTPLETPSSKDLARALQFVINQRLLLSPAREEAAAFGWPSSDTDVRKQIGTIMAHFPSSAEFEKRLRIAGFDSLKDERFERLMAERVLTERYLDVHFRLPHKATPEEEALYYDNIYVPEFREKLPGILRPPLEEKRKEINAIITERREAFVIEEFLIGAKTARPDRDNKGPLGRRSSTLSKAVRF